jgi:hypothetical protein
MSTPSLAQLLDGIPDDEKGRELTRHIRSAEAAYDEMYEVRGPSGTYGSMKESLRLAMELGLSDKVTELKSVLDHRKNLFRSQMS